jgi:hypothetical protein
VVGRHPLRGTAQEEARRSDEGGQAPAEKIAEKIDAALALGTFAHADERAESIPLDAHLRQWHARYAHTFKASYEETSGGIVRTISCRSSAPGPT